MKFDLTQYRNRKVVMNCKTRMECIIFEEFLHKHGKTWCDGAEYKCQNTIYPFQSYQELSCYNFNTGRYGDIRNYKSDGYKILFFSDFEWDGYSNKDVELTDKDHKQFEKFLSVCLS